MIRGMPPADNHVHTEWSWDAVAGSMEQSCARAVELGLPSIAFTEHLDLTRWVVAPEAKAKPRPDAAKAGPDGRFDLPALDVDGYLACVRRCRDRYPGLRILSGVEVGEPHWHEDRVKALLATADCERVLGSLHSLEVGGAPWIVDALYQEHAPGDLEADGIVRAYLAEALRMVESSHAFEVLAHIDYPLRRWPAGAAVFDPTEFEEEFRAVLRALARSGRVLEVNTVVPLPAEVIGWWYEVGGEAVSFGSDAHAPSLVARDFAHAAAMAEAQGFLPGRDPSDFWRRRP